MIKCINQNQVFYNIRVTLPLVCEKYLLDKECSSYYNQLIDRTMCVQIFFQVCTCYEFEKFLLAVDVVQFDHLMVAIFYKYSFQIWDMVESKQGYLTRVGLYKALALTALAQQGKTVSEKLLESFSGHGEPV